MISSSREVRKGPRHRQWRGVVNNVLLCNAIVLLIIVWGIFHEQDVVLPGILPFSHNNVTTSASFASINSPQRIRASVAADWVPELPSHLLDDPFSLVSMLDDESNSSAASTNASAAFARCALWLLEHPECRRRRRQAARQDRWTAKGCLGAYPLEHWVKFSPPSCPLKSFAKAIGLSSILSQSTTLGTSAPLPFLGDGVLAATRPLSSRRCTYVPPKDRTYSQLSHPQHRGAPPLKCPAINDRGTATHFLVHPYGYFIPEANLMFVDHFHRDHHQASSPGGRGGVPPSTLHTASPHPFLWDWHIVLPSVSPGGDAAGVTYPRNEVLFAVEDEVWYTLSLRYSRFAWTVRRTGQNTQRTMEILAAGGALPFYPYFNRCEERSPLVYDKNYSSRRDEEGTQSNSTLTGIPCRCIIHHNNNNNNTQPPRLDAGLMTTTTQNDNVCECF